MVTIVKMQLILLEIIKLEHFSTISILVKEVRIKLQEKRRLKVHQNLQRDLGLNGCLKKLKLMV